MTVFLSLMYGWLFAGTGRTDLKRETGTMFAADFQAHLGSLLSLSIATMMGAAQPVLLTFPSERPVFLREYAANQYGAVSYFVAKTLVELPVIMVSAFLQFLISYPMMGLQGNFLLLVVVSWLLAVTSSGLALLVGCGVSSVEKAMQLGPLTMLPQMLFSGLFVPVNKIPKSLRWAQYVCPLKYAVNVLGVIEFWDDRHVPEVINSFENQSIYFDEWERNLGLLVALYFFFRVVACVLLWRKGKYVF